MDIFIYCVAGGPHKWLISETLLMISIEPPFFSQDTASCSAHKEPSCQSPRFSMVHWPSSKTASLGDRKAAGLFGRYCLPCILALSNLVATIQSLPIGKRYLGQKTVPCFKDVIFKIASTMKCCDYFMWKFGLQDWQEIQPPTARLPQAAAQLLRAGGWKV